MLDPQVLDTLAKTLYDDARERRVIRHDSTPWPTATHDVRERWCAFAAFIHVAVGRVPADAPPSVTRLEVIDHRKWVQPFGRVFSAWDCRIELRYQDAGRTLKVFVDGEAPPPAREEWLARFGGTGAVASRPDAIIGWGRIGGEHRA